MDSGTVSGRFFVTAIQDGTSASVVLRSNTTLTQMYNPNMDITYDGTECTPNWVANNPLVWVSSSIAGIKKVPYSYTWYYNAEEIVFDDTTNQSTSHVQTINGVDYPVFERTTKTESGIAFPAIKILRNLARSNETDQDVIGMNGSLEINGSLIDFEVTYPVRLSQYSTSGWQGQLSGDVAVTTEGSTASVYAMLYNGTEQQTNFYTKWYDAGTDTFISGATSDSDTKMATFSINESSITDYIVLRCDFYASSSSSDLLYSAYWEIDDETDPEKQYIANGDSNNKNSASLRSGETVTFRTWMATVTDPTAIDTRFQYFYCKILDSTGAPVLSGTPMTGKTVRSTDGLFDVTSTITVPNVTGSVTGGSVDVDFDFAVTNGCTISGILVASTDEIDIE